MTGFLVSRNIFMSLALVVVIALPIECMMSSDCDDDNAVCLHKQVNVHGMMEYRSLCYCNDSYKRDSTGKCKAGKLQYGV